MYEFTTGYIFMIFKIDYEHRCDFSDALLTVFQVVADLNALF